MGLEDMGVLNIGWGICGVTSSLYALHSHSPSVKHSELSALATDKAICRPTLLVPPKS